MAPSCAGANRRELGCPVIIQQRLEQGLVGCMAPTKVRMFYKVRTILSIEMQAKQKLNGKIAVKRAYSLHCLNNLAGT
jgi:hypothetical protein